MMSHQDKIPSFYIKRWLNSGVISKQVVNPRQFDSMFDGSTSSGSKITFYVTFRSKWLLRWLRNTCTFKTVQSIDEINYAHIIWLWWPEVAVIRPGYLGLALQFIAETQWPFAELCYPLVRKNRLYERYGVCIAIRKVVPPESGARMIDY